MRDLTHPTWIKFKGLLFLLAGILAGGLLLLDHPAWRTGFLLAVVVWSFCRAYYFAFYVVERYLSPTRRFSGLLASARYLLTRGRSVS